MGVLWTLRVLTLDLGPWGQEPKPGRRPPSLVPRKLPRPTRITRELWSRKKGPRRRSDCPRTTILMLILILRDGFQGVKELGSNTCLEDAGGHEKIRERLRSSLEPKEGTKGRATAMTTVAKLQAQKRLQPSKQARLPSQRQVQDFKKVRQEPTTKRRKAERINFRCVVSLHVVYTHFILHDH